MARVINALVIKFAMTFVFSAVAFTMLGGMSWFWSGMIALTGTILNYLLGDLVVLPAFGNLTAAIGDGAMAAITALIFSMLIPNINISALSLGIFALGVAIGEYFFHQYLETNGIVNV